MQPRRRTAAIAAYLRARRAWLDRDRGLEQVLTAHALPGEREMNARLRLWSHAYAAMVARWKQLEPPEREAVLATRGERRGYA